jgi:hypothetical protein
VSLEIQDLRLLADAAAIVRVEYLFVSRGSFLQDWTSSKNDSTSFMIRVGFSDPPQALLLEAGEA